MAIDEIGKATLPGASRRTICTPVRNVSEEKAQLNFLRALLQIYSSGYAGKPVDSNPLQT
jgi:hypothetical protein